ncbi:MAG: hypothetical protein ACE5MH_10635, partial [Terriglobia bacterium]
MRAKLKNFWDRATPGPRARNGASLGAAAALLLLMGFMGSRLRTGLTTPVDVLIGLVLGTLAIALLAGSVALGAKLLRALPRYLGRAGTGALVAFLFLLLDMFRLPPPLGFSLAVGIVVAEALLGGAIALVTATQFKQARRGKKTGVLACLVVALAANLAFIWWLVAPGSDSHLVQVEAPAATNITPLEAPDPAQPGSYPVATLFYGSGTDKHRPAYGPAVDLKTEPVDATPFVKGFKGWRKKLRRWYWGFGPDAFPL